MAKNEVNFGTDAWGVWATGVQDRLDGMDAAALHEAKATAERFALMEKHNADLHKQLMDAQKPGKAEVAGYKAHNGDVPERLAALERAAGIHPVVETVEDVAVDDGDAS